MFQIKNNNADTVTNIKHLRITLIDMFRSLIKILENVSILPKQNAALFLFLVPGFWVETIPPLVLTKHKPHTKL